MPTNRLSVWLLIALALFALAPSAARADDALFPEFDEIKPNVVFWTDIYTRYRTTQAVVHDSLYLDVVYDVIDLEPSDRPGAPSVNRERMKAATHTYTLILQQLAADPSTDDADVRRVAARFAGNAEARRNAHHRVRCQIGQRDRFQQGLVRSGTYIDRIRAILSSYGVPQDLAYLPHVESSFDLNATSKFGAAGMWQFTRSTGRRFLTVDDVLDERLDPIAATHAAARLLKENHDKLGSWPLAITAYNHGAAGMQRAKAAHGDYPGIFTAYAGRTFKFASRNFYSEFLAARRIASAPARHFGNLTLDDPIRRRSYRLDGFAAFADLCRYFDLDPHAVRDVNPALRPAVLGGRKYIPKDYRLHLPIADEPDGDNHAMRLPAELYHREQKPSRFYTVQRGDTAGRIARLHRIGLDDLILANNLDRRATVYVHQTLRIPQPGASADRNADSRPADADDPAVVPATAPTDAAAIPADIPVESATVRFRRPEPAPADLLAMADAMPDAASAGDTADDPPPEAAAAAPPVDAARTDAPRLHPADIVCTDAEPPYGRSAEKADPLLLDVCRLDVPSILQPAAVFVVDHDSVDDLSYAGHAGTPDA